MKSKIGGLLMTAVIICSFVSDALPVSGNYHSFAGRQPKRTVRGYYCGQQSGNRSGDFYFRVGRVVRTFNMAFGTEEGGNAKLVGFKIGGIKIGNEYLISYRSDGDSGSYIESIKSTGRRKKIEPCPID